MPDYVAVRLNWQGSALPGCRLPEFRDVDLGPEPGWPFGRKGLALAGAWTQLQTRAAAGMLVQDGDVAADLADLQAMADAIADAPGDVITAPVRLWAASFHPAAAFPGGWCWAHWGDLNGNGGAEPSQELRPPGLWRFSFGFTYLPRRLLDHARASKREGGMTEWRFPTCDRMFSLCARDHHIPVRLAEAARPKHMNF